MKRTLAICSISFALFAAPGCDKHPTRPTSPPPPPPTPPTASTTDLQVSGPDRIAPGTTAQLTAKATKSDGSTEDVTGRVTWSSNHADVISVSPGGLVSGRSIGAAAAIASLEGFLAYAEHPLLVVPVNTFALSGIVRQTTVPVTGAKVEVVSASAGTGMRVFTDPQGHFDLFGVAGAVKLRVGKDDYHATFRTFDVSRDRTVEVELEPSDELPELRGAYLLTLSMRECTDGDLPKELRTRTYQARLTTEGDRVNVRLAGARFEIIAGHGDRFSIGVLPGEYALDLGTWESHLGDRPWDVLEQLDQQHSLGIYGTGRVTGTSARLAGELDGGFWVNPFQWDASPYCAGRVAVSLVRQ